MGVSDCLNILQGADLLRTELQLPGRSSVRRVHCDGNGEWGFALVAIPFEWGIREVDSVVQAIPVRLIRA